MARLISLLVSLLLAAPASAQVWVAPRRPGQTSVQYDAHDWKSIDLLVGDTIDGQKAGGVRLLFYEGEREAAERAAAEIVDAYKRLSDAFGYVPERRFPYILYNSYAEFLRTNLFPLQEGVLGVTSTTSLELTLPYFGDHRLFTEVGTHEMAHQFTIQKVRAAAKHAGAGRDALHYMPLWFIEGVAEYYAHGGLSGRNALLVRDVVTNPNLYLGHGMLGFYDDFPWSVLWTYQVGTARVTFLEETYGEGTLQALLEASPWLIGSSSAFLVSGRRFSKLVERVTGDDAHTVGAKFDAWIKRKAFQEWLSAEQTSEDFDPLAFVRGHVLAIDASPDGRMIAYRSIEAETGRSRLFVAPAGMPTRTRRLAAEGVPGTESLHPIDSRNFDLAEDRIAWVAESRGADTLVIQRLAHVVQEPRRRKSSSDEDDEPKLGPPPIDSEEPWAVTDWAMQASEREGVGAPPAMEQIRLGGKRRYRLAKKGIVAISSPAIGDDGRVAFIGLHRDGRKDVFVLDPEGPGGGTVTRLTNDVFAERMLTWHEGQVVYTSDATSHARFNLFRASPDGRGEPERLTTEPFDHLSPTTTQDGRLLFVGWKDDRANLFELVEGAVVQRTDFATGLFEPAPGPDDGLWALMQQGGRRTPVEIPRDALLEDQEPVAQGEGEPPAPLPHEDLGSARDYKALSPRNWRPENIFGIVAAGPGGLYGQVAASATDLLRDRALLFTGFFLGRIELTDGYVLYLDQSRRVTWGGGVFQSLRFRLNSDLADGFIFQSGERFYGGMVSVRYPLDRFVYLQVDQAVGATRYFLLEPTGAFLADGEWNGTGDNLLDDWRRDWSAVRPQTETTLRFGVDTVRYHYKTGPHSGSSLLLEGTGGTQPFHNELFGSVRSDVQGYVPLFLGSGSNLSLRASVGTSGGGQVARSFFLSSYDTLRGAYYGDPSVLLGRHFYFASTEMQLPLDAFVRFALASTIEAVAAVDFGGVADRYDELWDKRVLDVVLGGNLVIGPLVFRVHFARALDIGAPLPVPEGQNPWVPNLSLTWLQL